MELETEILKDLETSPEALPSSNDWINDDTQVIILKVESLLGVKEPYNMELFGKKMIDYICLATQGCSRKQIMYNEEADIITILKPYLNDKKYTAVLYSDTPLFDRATFVEVMEFMRAHSLNVLKLLRGYVFNTEYLRNAETIYASNVEVFNETAFKTASSAENIKEILEILHDNVIRYHIENGVIIVDPKSTFIDVDVVIEPGVIIEPLNVLKGLTCVDSEVIIESNCILKDCIISKGARIICSYLEECKVREYSVIGPYEKIINRTV